MRQRIKNKLKAGLEKHRKGWIKVAKEHNWYRKPFFIQLWVDENTQKVVDSVYLPEHAKSDLIVLVDEQNEREELQAFRILPGGEINEIQN